jgi:LPXTG-motif cell wall-anchored protein
MAVLGVLGALVALPMVAADAQTVPGEGAPPTPECVVSSFSPTDPVAQFPVQVTVQGTIDADATLTLYGAVPADSAPQVLATQVVSSGPFAISGELSGPGRVTVGITYGNEGAYAAACAAAGGVTGFEVKAETANRPGGTTGAAAGGTLAFTGSSDTPSYVLIGIAAIVVGAVLVVAARRRSHLS